jgi:Meckel syndrome type 1 protein
VPGTTYRDLASIELWEQSLERSRRRRVLAADGRRELNRRRTASFAVTAAVAAAPTWPTVVASADSLSGSDAGKLARNLRRDHGERVLLSIGDTGSAVIELQRKLRVMEDGIFGPQTRTALQAYQQRHGMLPTGKVDVRTWLKLFPTDMIIAAPSASVAALGVNDPSGGQWAALSAPTGSEASKARLAATRDGDPSEAVMPQVRDASLHVAGPQGFDDTTVPAGPPTAGSPAPGGAPTQAPAPGGGGGGGGGGGSFPVVPHPGGTVGQMIATMIAAANRIDSHHYAYRWGGGHNSSFSGPYDCSGAVSAVLHAAGLLGSPMVSGDFAHWGAPGAGAVTIYANASHVYMSINGHYFGTSGANPGGGAGWFAGGPRPGFAVVHVPFSKLHLRPATRARFRAAAPTRTSAESVSGGASAVTPTGRTTIASTTPTAPSAAPPVVATTTPAAAPAPAPAPARPAVVTPQPAAPPAVTAPAPAAPVAAAPAPTGQTESVTQTSGQSTPASAPVSPPAQGPAPSAAPPAQQGGAAQQPTPAPQPAQGTASPGAGSEGPSGDAAGAQAASEPSSKQQSPSPASGSSGAAG